jgi:hypothetical protein
VIVVVAVGESFSHCDDFVGQVANLRPIGNRPAAEPAQAIRSGDAAFVGKLTYWNLDCDPNH